MFGAPSSSSGSRLPKPRRRIGAQSWNPTKDFPTSHREASTLYRMVISFEMPSVANVLEPLRTQAVVIDQQVNHSDIFN